VSLAFISSQAQGSQGCDAAKKLRSCVARLYKLAQLPGPAYKLQSELGTPQASTNQGLHISQWHVQQAANRVRDCSERPSCDNNALLLLDMTAPTTWTRPSFHTSGPRHEPLASYSALRSCLIGVRGHVLHVRGRLVGDGLGKT
jgi:hypothetical protein